ncbi:MULTISPECIES: EF-P beta-lysylation protein EpmB [Halomonas]|uniref:EF-P beta-lysylation protein EpmB n=1 Tax=Halomonas TaxID=2745 RepID=UPI000EEAC9A5|nr:MULTISPECIES: EF-P beta-lysylation protein EpmB [Halomonas]HCR97606.1 EF-P beta-lysylation protein EpmB [Halomonas sp.]
MIVASDNHERFNEASSPTWQQQLSSAIRDPQELCKRLGLKSEWLSGAHTGHRLFETCVPEAYLSRITYGDTSDPLLCQVLPVSDEALTPSGYVLDPLEEADHRPAKGLIHKYAGRVLLIASPNCAINCRYCFRRHFPYSDNSPSRAQWQDALDYLRSSPTIHEAILSGGDPLAANDRQLAWLVGELEKIPHLKRLRIHTRLPVVIPDRIDNALLAWLGNTRLQKVVVLHINHANEIDQAVVEACTRLKEAGATLLNQSVLLRGVNDEVGTLTVLSERLFEAGILPYYLHVLDPVQGAAHFDVPDDEARVLITQLREHLPGFLMPRLVREVPGEASKTPL